MGISGNLKTMVLPELLQWLSMGQKSGTLKIDNGEVEKKIVFSDGAIVSSGSTDPKEYLGCFLCSHGYLPEEQIEEALRRQKSEKKLLGQILVNMGAIAEEDLHQVLRMKTEESIYDIFTWGEGDFEFFDDELPEETMIPMALDVQGLVLEGSRRLDEWQRIRELVPSPQCVPVAIVDLQALELDEIDLRILEWIDDDRTVEEISQGAQTSLFHVAGTIADQVRDGTVKVVRPRTVEVKVRVEVPAGAPAEAEPPAPSPAPEAVTAAPTDPSPPPPPEAAPTGPPVELSSGRKLHFATADQASPSAEAAIAAVPPAAAAKSEAETLVEQAEAALAAGDLEKALATFRRAKGAPGSDDAVAQAVQAGERKVQKALERDGIALTIVPRLECSMDQLTQLSISPQEGFMLTRVDGSYDLKSILKMSPMPQIDAQMLVWRLKKLGHVSV